MELKKSRYDNNNTLLFKYCYQNNVPSRLVLLLNDRSIINVIQKKYNINDISIIDIVSLIFLLLKYNLENFNKNHQNFLNLINEYNILDPEINIVIKSLIEIDIDLTNNSLINSKITSNDKLMAFYISLRDLEFNPDDILTLINSLKIYMNTLPFNEINELEYSYKIWYKNNYEVEFLKDIEILNEIYSFEEIFSSIESTTKPIWMTNPLLEITSTDFLFYLLKIPDATNSSLSILLSGSGMDIFKSINPSKFMPIIKFIDSNGMVYTRVFTGNLDKDIPNFDHLSLDNETSNDHIYAKIWVEEDTSIDLSKSLRNSFYIMDLDLSYIKNQVDRVSYKEPFCKVTIRTESKKASESIGEEKSILRRKLAIDHMRNSSGPLKYLFLNTKNYYSNLLNLRENKIIDKDSGDIVFRTTIEKEIVKGEFKIINFNFDENVFLHMIMNDELMNKYFYIPDHNGVYGIKRNLILAYEKYLSSFIIPAVEKTYISSMADILCQIDKNIQDIDKFEKVFTSYKPFTENLEMINKGTHIINCKISRASSKNIIEEFIFILNLLLNYYQLNYEAYSGIYYDNIPELIKINNLIEETNKQEIIDIRKRSGVSDIEILKNIAPDLFVENYARSCQAGSQPEIITDYSQLQNLKSQGKEILTMNQVKRDSDGELVPTTLQYHFSCPYEDKTLPRVKINKLSNKDLYPYIPCCYDPNTLSKSVSDRYSRFLSGLPPETGNSKSERIISSGKILLKHVIGYLPKNIDFVLSNTYKSLPDNKKFYRYGLQRSRNSIIHCLMFSIGFPNYIYSQTDIEREEICENIRQSFLETLPLAICKQELFDKSDQVITEMILDSNKSIQFDPYLFYRFLEEKFDVNIFVFSSKDNQPKSIDDITTDTVTLETKQSSLEIPRYKSFHIHNYIERKNIVIYKNYESEKSSIFQCEPIIISSHPFDNIVSIFDYKMGEVMMRIMAESNKIISCNIDNVQLNTELIIRRNIFYDFSMYDILNKSVVSQFIDYNGKARAFTIKAETQNKSILTTIYIIPSQPVKAPESKEIHKIKWSRALKIYGTPSGFAFDNSRKNIIAFFYQYLDIPNGICVPLIPEEVKIISEKSKINFSEMNIYEYFPIFSPGNNITKRITKMKSDLQIIKGIIVWLYEITKYEYGNNHNLPMFFDKYFYVSNFTGDSENYYKLDKIHNILPRYSQKNSNDGKILFIIYKYLENFFNNSKNLIHRTEVKNLSENFIKIHNIPKNIRFIYRINMYNEKFMQRIRLAIKDYDEIQFGKEPNILRSINLTYGNYEKFNKENTRFFIGNEFQEWIEFNKRQALNENVDTFTFHDFIANSLLQSKIISPYLFENNNEIFIIQNVYSGLRNIALNVSYYWYKFYINIGYNPLEETILDFTENFPAHKIFCISIYQTIELIDDFSYNSEKDYLSLLYLGTFDEYFKDNSKKFASLLKVA